MDGTTKYMINRPFMEYWMVAASGPATRRPVTG